MEIRPDLERQVNRLREPFAAFVGAQTTASGFLLLAVLAALAVVNSPWQAHYESLRHYSLGLMLGDRAVVWSLLHLVNDGLIAVFFFLIGLEVKRELLAGELRETSRVSLLLGAALGGMLLPAGIYLLVNSLMPGGELHGWGIPMATDTAIALGVLAALGARAPRSVVAFLVGLAIIDDIGAILVIALFYTEQLALAPLVLAGLLLAAMLLFNQAGLRHPLLYFLGAVLLWILIVQSNVHASIAGVVAAATVPARPRMGPGAVKRRARRAVHQMPADADPEQVLGEAETHQKILEMERLAQEGTTPLRRWEAGLELPVALLVLPLFAFLNAGVPVTGEALFTSVSDAVSIGILLGLLIGKPLGIMAGVWLAERLAGARRPQELDRRRLAGVGMLAGVGFTMSTFIANLALGQDSETLATVKLSILLASFIAALAGYLALRHADRSEP